MVQAARLIITSIQVNIEALEQTEFYILPGMLPRV